MTVSYLIGNNIGPVFIADAATGTVSLVPGLPIIATSIPAQALSAGLVTDPDGFYSPSIATLSALLPALVPDADTFNAPSIANTTQFLQLSAVADAEVFYTTTVTPAAIALAPVAFNDTDTFFAPSIASGIVSLVPALLSDSDSVPTPVDVGWQLYGQLLIDVDLVLSPHVETLAYLLPNDVFEDGDTIDTYPFYIHAVTGGIPVPPPSGVLSGSISYPRRLTGTLDRRPRLTGSIKRSTRVLTGSLKR